MDPKPHKTYSEQLDVLSRRSMQVGATTQFDAGPFESAPRHGEKALLPED